MPAFRTTEISNPDYESANLRFITVKTPHLKGRGDMAVFVPPGQKGNGNLPLVILLHGVYGSAWCWPMKAAAHLTALRLIENQKIQPMVIVTPSDGLWGDGSGYLPHNGYHFEHWIVNDVPLAVCENIPETSLNNPLFIAGLSMGGFGALRLGAKYAGKFSGISAHSAITALPQMGQFVEEPLQKYQQSTIEEESAWGQILKNRGRLPPIRFDCGLQDDLLAHNQLLHQQMEQAGIPHQYQEFAGGHEWPYWTKHLEDTLLFFNQILTEH